MYSNLAWSAMARNVVVKQLAIAPSKRSSGVHRPSIPPKLTGAVKWIALGAESAFAMPVRPEDHHATTRNLCACSITSLLFRLPGAGDHFPLTARAGRKP